jgi:DNA-binding response OmpR family regulator
MSVLKALHEFHSGLYDVAILDIMMSTMNGIGFSKNLIQVDNAIKIIFLTTTNGDNKEINTVTSNLFWIIRKPITVNNLFEELISILALEQNIPLL